MDGHHDLESDITARVPDLQKACAIAVESQAILAGLVVTDANTHVSDRVIVNQAVNDLYCLITELRVGNGRSAIRSSRSLIEHAINLHSVSTDIQMAQRYIEHLDQGRVIMMEVSPGLDLLKGSELKSYRHLLRSQGRPAKARFSAAVRNWGANFRRQWTPRALAVRADAAGMSKLYELYRLASLVTHGSAAGSLGTLRPRPDHDTYIYRTGHALELSPIAMYAGLLAYLNILHTIHTFREDIDDETYAAGVMPLMNLWPVYFLAIREIDNSLWPKHPTNGPQALIALHRKGKQRFYLHMPELHLLYPAKPLDPSWIADSVHELINRATADPTKYFPTGDDWITIQVLNTVLTPTGRPPIPDSALLKKVGRNAYFKEIDLSKQ